MAFIIDRNALKAINRRTAEHLRSRDGHIKKEVNRTGPFSVTSFTRRVGAEIMSPPAAHFSRDDIRKALMLATKMITPFADTMRANDQSLGGLPAESAPMKKA